MACPIIGFGTKGARMRNDERSGVEAERKHKYFFTDRSDLSKKKGNKKNLTHAPKGKKKNVSYCSCYYYKCWWCW
jgi:hypothetical protein